MDGRLEREGDNPDHHSYLPRFADVWIKEGSEAPPSCIASFVYLPKKFPYVLITIISVSPHTLLLCAPVRFDLPFKHVVNSLELSHIYIGECLFCFPQMPSLRYYLSRALTLSLHVMIIIRSHAMVRRGAPTLTPLSVAMLRWRQIMISFY